MFGFGKKKTPEPQRPERARRSGESKERKSQSLAQLGFLAGVSDDGDIDNLMGNMDVGDDDLEDELSMLLSGKEPPPRRPKTSPQKRPGGGGGGGHSGGGRKSAGRALDFDVNNFDNDVEDEDDGDLDLDDPDLEAELGDILGVPSTRQPSGAMDEVDDNDSEEDEGPQAPPTMTREELLRLLQERLDLYEKAKAAADTAGETAKSRRFDRGLKTLKGLLSKAKAGRVIDESEIPPAVSIGVLKKDPEPAISPQDSTSHPVPYTDTFEEPVPEVQPPIQNYPKVPPRPRPAPDSHETSSGLPEPLNPTPVNRPTPPPRPVPRTILPETPQSNFSPTVPETRPVPVPESLPIDPLLEARLKEYKLAAVSLKRQGDVQGAVKYLKLSKTIEAAAKSGEHINLDELPTIGNDSSNEIVKADPPHPVPELVKEQPSTSAEEGVCNDPTPQVAPPAQGDIFGAPPPPKSVMEALEQRLDKYKSEVEKATAASNSSKARRMGRIVKQYEEAIMHFKKGKPVVFDELPTPPGFAPIPVGGPPAIPQRVAEPPNVPQRPQFGGSPDQPGGSSPKPTSESPRPGPSPGSGQSPSSTTGSVTRAGKQTTKLTLQEKQLQAITIRKQQFMEAALNAKKRGDVNQAREFLRTAKGFDKLIQVAQAGLPVDMATLPAPPDAVAKLELEEESNFEMINASDCIMPTGDAAEVFAKLETDLKQQLKMCMRTRDHFKSIGDVASANRFETMALESKRDLDAMRLAMKKNGGIPNYHYENRIFSITECNTDIREDEIEISILQGTNYKVSNPEDVDTYVKVELHYPSTEEVQINKTQVVKDTNNPAYNATYKMSINRTARNFQRFVHRHGFKCEVWSKGGLFRGSSLIGTATVKLLPLETKCTLHDGFDILDGRKSVGKLEVKVKIREPVLTKQITQKKEKWLSIDRA